ncbi:C6 zinc finger domain-containing protein [Aspergillus sclerotioniger CBS 115572]|uniref:C6 zinc finger domain-containing protein n=1 Tax=Aspergillus sclerotioniger CBS 115572 TaxID=1450535 RepID=A0A317WWE7_9EURO|nr:C6 zinc finger domain-containing protein [Aspergillus sclerotioniger CBS 115572]PWY90375.1 C6 zinc finger domain-containing protein [Aspergillus sclerotioniger CBS 115572]
MVGVAGKSKGCNTCRARKIAVGANSSLPCGQCTRLNRVCGGYQRERVFVLVQPDAAPTKKHIFLRSSPSERSSPAELSDNGVEECLPLPAAYPLTERGPAYATIQTQNECHNLVLSFLSNCLPASQSSSLPRSWMPLLAELPTRGKALQIAGAAVAASAIGHRFRDPALIRESLNLYTQGLRQLQSALWNRHLVHDDGTLAACMALSLYEAMECPSAGSEGYFGHCQGLLALVQARGIQAHCTGAGHQLFLGVRMPAILYALEHQAPSFMFDAAWMEQPWELIPKTFMSRVVDCLAKSPKILQRVSVLYSLGPEDQGDLYHELIHECWQIDEELDLVWDKMQDATPGPLYWPVPSQMKYTSTDSAGAETPFSVVFCFPSQECATTLILLWAVRVMLWSGLCHLYAGLAILNSSMASSTVAVHPTLPALGHRRDYLSMAHHVCQSTEYILQDEQLLAGPLAVSPALGIVLDTLRDQPCYAREVAWLRTILGVVRQRGLGVLKHSR